MSEPNEQQTGRAAVSRRAKVCFALLAAGFLILANPLIGCVDLIPDPIGWILIWFALARYTVRSEPMRKARKWAILNLLVGLLRLFLQFAFPSNGYPSDLLMTAAVVGVLDIFGMTLFFLSFFRGFEELSKYAEDENLYVRSDNFRFLSILFVWIRTVCMVLPELTALASLFVSHYGPGDLSGFDDVERAFLILEQIGSSRVLFVTIFAVFALIGAVVWLVQILPGVRRFTKDPGIADYLEEPLTEEETQAVRYEKTGVANLTVAKFVTAAAALCALDLNADGFRFLPFGLFPLLMIAVCLLLDRFRTAQESPKLFRRDWILFAVASGLLIGFEFFRRFATVWDARAFEENEWWQFAVSAGWMLIAGVLLFAAWYRFSLHANGISAPYRVGLLYLNGLPYALLLAVYALQTVVCASPSLSRILLFPRIFFVAAFAFVCFRRMSALDERIRQRLAEEPSEPHPGHN